MYQSLQSGRAIAAILVVLFHLGGAIAAEKYFNIGGFSVPFSFGNSGVDFFFVLSGFIIFHAHNKDIGRPQALVSYLYKRITRIYPVYIIVFAGVYLLAFITPQLRNTVPHDLAILFKSILLLPQDKNLVGGTGAPVLGVAWTLQFEILFYLAFSLGIINKRLGQISVILFALFALFGPKADNYPVSFFSSDYILLFLMGMLSAQLITHKKPSINLPLVLAIIGIFIYFVTAIDVIIENNHLTSVKTILNGVGCSFIVMAMALYEKRGKIFLKNNFCQLLGASSYSLYLLHYPLISILCKLSIIIGLQQAGVLGALTTYIFVFFACIFSSVAFHLLIEKPISKKLRSIVHKPNRLMRQTVSIPR